MYIYVYIYIYTRPVNSTPLNSPPVNKSRFGLAKQSLSWYP